LYLLIALRLGVLKTQDFELHQLHLLICVKLGIGGRLLLRGGMKASGAERDTVGVQGPVGRGLVMHERGVCVIDGCSERMTGKVVDVQVV
jgi:hypothetical protein